MRPIRRLTALLLNLLLLQLTLGGSAGACGDHERAAGSQGMTPAHQMAGMAHHEGDRGTPADPCHEHGGAGRHPDGPCQMPGSPGACASMTSCAALVFVPAASGRQVAVDHAVVPATAPTFTRGVAAAPELPPPRA